MRTLSLDFLFFTGVIISLIHFVYREAYLLQYFMICGILLMIFFILKKGKKYYSVILFTIVFSVLFSVKTIYFQSVNHPSDFVLLISHFGYGMYLIEQRKALKVISFIYIVMGLYVSFVTLSEGQINNISSFSSANIVNYVVLAFSILVIGLYYLKNNIILISPAIFSVVISFISLGRAGMIASVILVISLVVLKYKKTLNKFTLGLLMIIFIVSSYYLYNFVVFLTVNIFTKFGQSNSFIEDSPRTLIWQSYQNNLDIPKFIFGYDSKIYTFYGYDNLHNSFLDIHYTFGIGGLLIIMLLISIMLGFVLTKEYLFLTLISVLLLRAMTDTVMLVGMYDFVLIFFVLILNDKMYNKEIFTKTVKHSGTPLSIKH